MVNITVLHKIRYKPRHRAVPVVAPDIRLLPDPATPPKPARVPSTAPSEPFDGRSRPATPAVAPQPSAPSAAVQVVLVNPTRPKTPKPPREPQQDSLQLLQTHFDEWVRTNQIRALQKHT